MRLTSPNEIKALMERHGLRFSKGLGQNLLIEPSVPRRIAEAGCEGGGEGLAVLEVGPGVGCLTSELAQRAERVLAVELDRGLLPVLAETLAGCPNAEVVQGDALKTDLAALLREKCPGMRYRVCANLPYNVTTPLLAKFIDAGIFEQITVMIQREVALRLTAAPGTPDYGAFSLYLNWHCEAERLFDVPPECFMPRPKVTSSVVRLRLRAEKPCPVRDEALEKQLSFVGWVEAGEVYRLCAERDISVSTIRRARVALGLKTLYIGNQPNRKNYWYQPELEEASVVADITNQNQQIQLA